MGDPLGVGHCYGAGLPGRNSGKDASIRGGLAQVVSVLPDEAAAPGFRAHVVADAQALLLSLRAETKANEFTVRLELVVGDTCQLWHHDHNVLRSIVTYVGPGTMVADENGVARGEDGRVLSVRENAEMQ